ncbi:hypothetical protein Tco_0491211 [Tanacetum coccineum]
MNRLKNDIITKADLEGPTFMLLKGTCRNRIKLEYNIEQCYLALSDKLDWTNPEGDRCPFDMTNPLPLQGLPCNLTTKAVKYDLKFIEDMIPSLWSSTKVAYDKYVAFGISHWSPKRQLFYRSRIAAKSPHEVFSHLQILGVVRLSIDYQFGYGYLKEIVVRRADLKEYSFREADFSRLHLNDIEDLFVLYVQRKIYNLLGDQIIHLSYQKKLNIIKPQTKCDGISVKEPYTIFDKPRGVVYLNRKSQKRLMKADELYKFCNGSNFVGETLRKSDQLHQTFEKSSTAMTRKLDDMIKLHKSQPKRTYNKDLECEIVMVRMPKYMAWLDDEPISDLDMMEDKVDSPSPQSTPQFLLSVEVIFDKKKLGRS